METNKGRVTSCSWLGVYSPEFVKAVKDAFPLSERLHQALDRGQDYVGRYLDDARLMRIRPERIVQLLEQEGGAGQLLAEARWAMKKEELYAWCLRELGYAD